MIAFAWNVHPRWRLLLVGNRDEFHARPSAPLARWENSPIIAGRDLLAGGTWLGVTATGRCAVVTNVRDPRAATDGQSRGLLVSDYLAAGNDARDHGDALRLRAPAYRPFNLLVFDADTSVFTGNHPGVHQTWLQPGVHALSNANLDTPWPKVCALRAHLQAWLAAGGDNPLPLLDGLADERRAADADLPDTGIGLELERKLSPAFVRGEQYGTRASTLVAIARDGHGMILERSFGPDGAAGLQTRVDFAPPDAR